MAGLISPAGVSGVTIGQMTPWMGVWGMGSLPRLN